MNILHGRRIVITGSSRGLGRAFAVAMAKEGASLVLNGTNADALRDAETLVRKVGGKASSVLGSVADSAVCAKLVQTCVEHFGGIDVLVNNAGVVRDRTLSR